MLEKSTFKTIPPTFENIPSFFSIKHTIQNNKVFTVFGSTFFVKMTQYILFLNVFSFLVL